MFLQSIYLPLEKHSPLDRKVWERPFTSSIKNSPPALLNTRRIIQVLSTNAIGQTSEFYIDHTVVVDQVVLTFDAASVFEDVLSHPAKFGFKDTTQYVPNLARIKMVSVYTDFLKLLAFASFAQLPIERVCSGTVGRFFLLRRKTISCGEHSRRRASKRACT